MDNIINFTKERLRGNPVVYTIMFIHDENGMHFEVFDIQDTEKDRAAVARDLIAAADSLQDDN